MRRQVATSRLEEEGEEVDWIVIRREERHRLTAVTIDTT